MIVWFTGQPGSGKSTLANALATELRDRGHRVLRIDGEELRRETGNADFSEAGRIRNVRAGQQRAVDMVARGFIVVASFVSPHRSIREQLKTNASVVEVYAHRPERGPKGEFHVAGYEAPVARYLDVDTSLGVEECVAKILNAVLGSLETRGQPPECGFSI